MRPILRWCCVAAVLLLAGCSSLDRLSKREFIVAPLQPRFEQEVALLRLNQILASSKLNKDDRAELLYDRGKLYDSLGLRILARNDFSQALSIQPKSPLIFDYLGMYLMLVGNFDAAYEAFDSVIELDPTYKYAFFNLGVALYYGGRYTLAQDDLQAFYQSDTNNPYVSLWLYLVAKEIDTKQALVSLQARYNIANKASWGWNIVEFYLGDISEKTLMERLKADVTDNTSLAEHLSKTYFYLGKYYLSLGDKNSASALFKLTIANNVNYFVEHRFALLELAQLG